MTMVIDFASIWVPIILTLIVVIVPWFWVEDNSGGYGIDLTPLFTIFGSVVVSLIIWLVWALVK